jgi:hypothetical protein
MSNGTKKYLIPISVSELDSAKPSILIITIIPELQ